MEGIGAGIRAESAGDFLFYFQLSYSSLRTIVVGWNRWIFKEIEDIIATLDYPSFQLVKFFPEFIKVLLEQLVQPVKPSLLGN